MPSHKLVNRSVVVGFLVAIPVLTRTSWAQETPDSYSDLLRKAIVGARIDRGGTFRLLYPSAGWHPPGPQFSCVRGLGNGPAAPFLIDVLRDGPGWSDAELPKGKGNLYRYVARCYAALGLGSTSDSRAFEPLLAIVTNADIKPYEYRVDRPTQKGQYNLRCYAAFALGILGDQRAVEPLESTLKREGFVECAYALARLHAVPAAPTIISVASARNLFTVDLHQCLEYMLRTKFDLLIAA